MEIKEEKERLQFYKLLKEMVLPQLFESYIRTSFEFRDKEDKWDNRAPVSDLFHPFEEREGNPPKQFIGCIVPNIRIFWDIILAAYYIYAPTVFPSTQFVALCVTEVLGFYKNEIDLKIPEIGNYGKTVHAFLSKYAMGVKLEGGNFNMFLKDPVSSVFLVKRTHVLMGRKYIGTETEEDLKDHIWNIGFHPETQEKIERPANQVLEELFNKTKLEVNAYFN